MKLSEAWLREWVNPPGDTAALVEQLTMHGLEVDGVEPVGTPIQHVVAGLVVEVAAHPDADRLRVCQVDGGGGRLQVVCGAPNVRAGGIYPLALPGAVLPGGLAIKPTVLRGVPSGGMLCSGAELGLADQSGGLLELDPGTAPGTPVSELLVLGDHVLDINITPNRADCFSVAGMARDVAATAGLPFAPRPVPPVPAALDESFPATLEAGDACPRLALRVIRGLDPGARTPLWMRERLRRAGIRAIHPVVDVTNYVMLETGQPLHGYDLARVQGPLAVRLAGEGEKLRLLGGQEQALDADVLVIADAHGPVGMAGIMGGEGTGVAPETTDVLLESAWFAPAAIAGRARRYGLQTDASMRFERGVDPTGQEAALERATALLLAMAGGQAGPVAAHEGQPTWHGQALRLRRARLRKVLGTEVPDGDVVRILASLGMAVTDHPEGWAVTPPPFRFDMAGEVDLIEEVARVFGYDRIPAAAGRQAVELGRDTESRVRPDRVRQLLVDRGYQEAITYSFTDPVLDSRIAGGIPGTRLVNPIASDLAVMRQSLWTGLLGALRHNVSRQQERIRFFEIGLRFIPQGNDIKEEKVLAGVALGPVLPEQWDAPSRPCDFFDIKSDLEALLDLSRAGSAIEFQAASHPALHPGQSARLIRDAVELGWLGALHPAIAAEMELAEAPVLFELDLDRLLRSGVPGVSPPSRFPAVRRDLAVLVEREVPVAALRASVTAAAGPALRDVIVFDVYAGERIDPGVKSVALGLILQETSRTLTDVEVDAIVGGVVSRLTTDFNARIRE